MTTGPLRHRARCTGPDLTNFIGLLGDAMEKCRTCGATRPLQEAEAEVADLKPRTPPSALDNDDIRQATRSGSGWPRHKARRRSRARR